MNAHSYSFRKRWRFRSFADLSNGRRSQKVRLEQAQVLCQESSHVVLQCSSSGYEELCVKLLRDIPIRKTHCIIHNHARWLSFTRGSLRLCLLHYNVRVYNFPRIVRRHKASSIAESCKVHHHITWPRPCCPQLPPQAPAASLSASPAASVWSRQSTREQP